MEDMILIKPTEQYLEEIAAYRAEFVARGDSMDGCGSLRRVTDPLEWLRDTARASKKETVRPDLVVATQFIGVRPEDNRLIGMIQVRHYFNDYLEKYAGHIGYSVRPSERKRGYAKQMLRACLPYCREIGLEKVLITCDETNEASRRTILANGGVYESTVYEPDKKINIQRYWIKLHKAE